MNMMFYEQTYDDIDMEVSFREDKLEIERAMHETTCLLDTYAQLSYMEASDDSTGAPKRTNGLIGGIVKAFKTIIDKIRKVLNSISEGFSQSFGKQLDENTYKNSETAQVRFSTDIRKICNDLDAEYNHARKLVRMIANHTPLSEKQVADFLDNTSNMFHKHGPAVVKTSLVFGIGAALRKKARNLNKLTDEAELACKDINTADSTQVKLAQKVLSGIFSLSNTVLNSLVMVENVKGTYARNVVNDEMRAAKAAKKRAKKGMK